METLKQPIQHLDLKERISLLAWLAQDVQAATEERTPPQWMFDVAERAYAQFVSADEEAISWEQLRNG